MQKGFRASTLFALVFASFSYCSSQLAVAQGMACSNGHCVPSSGAILCSGDQDCQIRAQYIKTQEDLIGTGPTSSSGDGAPDHQLEVQGISGNIRAVRIQGALSDTWQWPNSNYYWNIVSRPTTTPGVYRFNFAPSYAQKAFRITIQYEDNSMVTALAPIDPAKPDYSGIPDAPSIILNLAPVSTTPTATPAATTTPVSFSATYAATTEDKIGPGPGIPNPDGAADRQVVVRNLKATPVGILIQGRNNDTWINPSNGTYWPILTATITGGLKLNFAPSQVQTAYRVSVQYPDNSIDSAIAYVDPTKPDASGLPSAPTVIVKTANNPPAVSLTSPANNSTFTAPATITLSASASDTDGSVARVDFYNNGTTLIGSDTTAPYSISWANVAAGTGKITAQAIDNAGAVSTSAAVTVSITSPISTTFSASYVTTTEDRIGPGPGAPTPDGAADRQVIVSNLKATPVGILIQGRNNDTWINPSNGTYWSIFSATVTGGLKLNFAPCQAQTAYRVSVQYPDNSIDSAIAYVDPANPDASGLPSAPTVIVKTANIPPTVSLTAPTNNASYPEPANITVSATASDADGSIKQVDFYNGTALIGSDTTAPYSVTWSNVSAGTGSITARAVDNQGAATTSAPVAITVTKANTAPTVAIGAPTPGSSFAAPATITITANASDSDGTVSRVEFYNGTTLLGSDTSSSFSFSWTNVPAGSYSLTARAYDNAGAQTTSAAVSVTVTAPTNSPPSVALTSPSSGTTVVGPASLTFSATASDTDGTVAKVDFLNGSTVVGSDSTAPYSVSWSNVAAGTYSLAARAVDNGGAATTSSPVSVTVSSSGSAAISYYFLTNGQTVPAPTFIAPQVYAVSNTTGVTVSEVRAYLNGALVGSAKANSMYARIFIEDPKGSYTFQGEAVLSNGTVSRGQLLSFRGGPLPTRPVISAPVKNPWFTSAQLTSMATTLDATLDATKVIPADQRLFPQYTAPSSLYPGVSAFLSHSKSNPQGSAGGFDDRYQSLDGGHSNWSGSWNSPSLLHRYISQASSTLSANFTSNSTVGQGHQSILNTPISSNERDQLFRANMVSAAPSYKSFDERYPDMPVDSYDALTFHNFRSVGQSGSEISGIAKMVLGGASLPWSVKRQVKQTGNYGALALYLYRMSLPYADAQGSALPPTHELFHRHSYLSVGSQVSQWAFANNWGNTAITTDSTWYHQYQNERHWHDIMKLARSLSAPPAFTVLRIKNFTRTRVSDGVVVETGSGADGSAVIISEAATSIRLWPKRDEVLNLTISLAESYDLNGLPLTYDIRPVYENQARAITITRLANPAEFSVTFRYDATLPRGRIPLIATARNGVTVDGKPISGTPAFINAYYPLPGQTLAHLVDYGTLEKPESVVQWNKRPVLTIDAPQSQIVAPGTTVSFKVSCTDPEGFPTKIYRWLGEPGSMSGDTFSVTLGTSYEGKSLPFHFICSDGTGAYNAAEVSIGVGRRLSSGFTLVDVGTMNLSSRISEVTGGGFSLQSDSAGRLSYSDAELAMGLYSYGNDHGSFLAMPVSGDFDIQARVDKATGTADLPSLQQPSIELMFRKNLGIESPGDTIGLTRNDVLSSVSRACAGTARLDYNSTDWRAYMYGCNNAGSSAQPSTMRLIRRSEAIGFFMKRAQGDWEHVYSLPPDTRWNRTGAGFAGLFFAGRNINKYVAKTLSTPEDPTTGSVPAALDGLIQANTSTSLPIFFSSTGKLGANNDSRISIGGGSTTAGAQILTLLPANALGLLVSQMQLVSFTDTSVAPIPTTPLAIGDPIKIFGTGVFEVRAQAVYAGGVLGDTVAMRLNVSP